MINNYNFKYKDIIVGSILFILIIINYMNSVEIKLLKKKLSASRTQITIIKRQIISLRSSNYDTESEIQDLQSRIDDLESENDNRPSPFIPFNLN